MSSTFSLAISKISLQFGCRVLAEEKEKCFVSENRARLAKIAASASLSRVSLESCVHGNTICGSSGRCTKRRVALFRFYFSKNLVAYVTARMYVYRAVRSAFERATFLRVLSAVAVSLFLAILLPILFIRNAMTQADREILQRCDKSRIEGGSWKKWPATNQKLSRFGCIATIELLISCST